MENTIYSAKKFIESTNQDILELAQRGKFVEIQKMFVAYANSVRPEVVVPSEKEMNEAYIRCLPNGYWGNGWKAYENTFKSLNPTMTFTELNHNEK